MIFSPRLRLFMDFNDGQVEVIGDKKLMREVYEDNKEKLKPQGDPEKIGFQTKESQEDQ